MTTQLLTVETRPDGIIIYQLNDQTSAALTEWIRRVTRDLDDIRKAQQPGQPGMNGGPRRIIHDLRRCGMPKGSLLSHLSVGLGAGRDLAISCAVVGQDRIAVSIFKRLLGVPSVGGSDTLPVLTRNQVWSPTAEVRFFCKIEEAEAWLVGLSAATS